MSTTATATETATTANGPMPDPQLQTKTSRSSTRRSRSKTRSNDIPRVVQGPSSTQYGTYYAPNNAAVNGMPLQGWTQQPLPTAAPGAVYYHPNYGPIFKNNDIWSRDLEAMNINANSGHAHKPPKGAHHARNRSWSGEVSGQPIFLAPPPPPLPPPPPPVKTSHHRHSMNASGLSSSFSESKIGEQQPLLKGGSQHSERVGNRASRRSSRNKGDRRRSHSSSEAMPGMYGAFWDDPAKTAQLQQQQQHHLVNLTYQEAMEKIHHRGFSPRDEILLLTGSLRGGRESPLLGPASSTSPRISPVVHGKMWGGSPSVSLPTTPLLHASVHGSSNPFHQGGEAVFLAAKKSKPESQRKMHMRQHSAQQWVETVKGQPQSPACRDVIFLLIFVFHLLFIGYLGEMYGREALQQTATTTTTTLPVSYEVTDENVTSIAEEIAEGEPVKIYYNNLLYISLLCGPFAVALSAMLLCAMTIFARYFVQIALIMVITLSFIWGTVGVGLSPKTAVPVTGIIALALTVAYAFIVWDRIPFASVNLLTALTGVQAYPATIVVAFCCQALALIWSVYFTVVVCGIYDALNEGTLSVPHQYHGMIYILLGFSYYWTCQVLQNIVQVTTAAIIGGWWYTPGSRSIVGQAYFKTFFYCMGSICYGSLFIGPVRILRQLSALVRPTNVESTSLMCVHECVHCIQLIISTCVDSIAYRFNAWGFTYVGLYGYGFLDASFNASVLFERRGWTVIVSDDLVPNILFITSFVVGGVTGCFAHLISKMESLHFTTFEHPGLTSFFAGGVIGLVVTSVLFAVISSSVNAVIVCFAASPVDFEENHPELSHEMRSAWREVFPGALDEIDLGLDRLGIIGPIPRRGSSSEASPAIL